MSSDEYLEALHKMRETAQMEMLLDKACQNAAKKYISEIGDVLLLEGKLIVRFDDLVLWIKDNHFVFKSRENKKEHWKYLENLVYVCTFFTSYIKYKVTGKGDQEHIRISDSGKGPKYYPNRYKIKQNNYFNVCPEFLAEAGGNCNELTEHGIYAIYMFGKAELKNTNDKIEKCAVIVGSLILSVCSGGVLMYTTFDNKAEVNIMPYKDPAEFWYYLFAIIGDNVNGPLAYARLMYTAAKYDEMKESNDIKPFDHVAFMRYTKLSNDPFPLSWMSKVARIYNIL